MSEVDRELLRGEARRAFQAALAAEAVASVGKMLYLLAEKRHGRCKLLAPPATTDRFLLRHQEQYRAILDVAGLKAILPTIEAHPAGAYPDLHAAFSWLLYLRLCAESPKCAATAIGKLPAKEQRHFASAPTAPAFGIAADMERRFWHCYQHPAHFIREADPAASCDLFGRLYKASDARKLARRLLDLAAVYVGSSRKVILVHCNELQELSEVIKGVHNAVRGDPAKLEANLQRAMFSKSQQTEEGVNKILLDSLARDLGWKDASSVILDAGLSSTTDGAEQMFKSHWRKLKNKYHLPDWSALIGERTQEENQSPESSPSGEP